MCRKYGTRIPPNPARTPAGTFWFLPMEHLVPHYHPTPIFPSAFLILICIKKHPRANDSTQSRSVSLQSALTTPASRALVAHDGMEVLAALTSPSQCSGSFSLCSSFQRALSCRYMRHLAPRHSQPTLCLVALPGDLKSRGCIRTSSWHCKANGLLTSSRRCPVRV